MTTTTTPVEAHLNIPLEDGSLMTLLQRIQAKPTATPGLVTFPLLLGPLEVDTDWWCVTHAATGKRLPVTFRSEEDAVAFAGAVGELADWTATPTGSNELKAAVMSAGRDHGGLTDSEYARERGRQMYAA